MKRAIIGLCVAFGLAANADAGIYPNCTTEDWQMGMCWDYMPTAQANLANYQWSIGVTPVESRNSCTQFTGGSYGILLCKTSYDPGELTILGCLVQTIGCTTVVVSDDGIVVGVECAIVCWPDPTEF